MYGMQEPTTITDAQIRDLAREYSGHWSVTDDCGRALGCQGFADERQAARVRLAQILNARSAS